MIIQMPAFKSFVFINDGFRCLAASKMRGSGQPNAEPGFGASPNNLSSIVLRRRAWRKVIGRCQLWRGTVTMINAGGLSWFHPFLLQQPTFSTDRRFMSRRPQWPWMDFRKYDVFHRRQLRAHGEYLAVCRSRILAVNYGEQS